MKGRKKRIAWMVATFLFVMLALIACGGGGPASGEGPQKAMADIPEGALVIGEGELEAIAAKASYAEGFGEQKRCTVTLVNEDEERTFVGTVYAVFVDADGNVLGQEKKTLSGFIPGKQVDLVFWADMTAVDETPQLYMELTD